MLKSGMERRSLTYTENGLPFELPGLTTGIIHSNNLISLLQDRPDKLLLPIIGAIVITNDTYSINVPDQQDKLQVKVLLINDRYVDILLILVQSYSLVKLIIVEVSSSKLLLDQIIYRWDDICRLYRVCNYSWHLHFLSAV